MAEQAEPDWAEALTRARTHAPFLARALDRQGELAEMLARGEGEAALTWANARGEHEDAGVGLRRHRLALAATLAVGDLAGAFALPRVLSELSSFADQALDCAIRTAIAERTGADNCAGMIALALGKQGAGELNYSSDIDPILLYDPATLTRRESDDPGEAAQRYARRVVQLLSDNTAEGYVLRVDLRLRPASEVSPLAVPRATAMAHYQGQALAWERAAFIRARAAAGDIAAGEAFLGEIAPFVWRQALDFGAIEEIRALTRRIRDNNSGPDQPGPGFDVKRGRGGIREIEFFAQTHQLIHGGRDASLRVRGTRAALDALASAGRIEADHARILGEGYDRLRTIEHRLQMVNDRQTHELPEGDALAGVAYLDGMGSGAALVAELTELTAETARIYETLIGRESASAPATPRPSELATDFKTLEFKQPEALAKRVEGWRDGRFASVRSPQAIAAFDALLPKLMSALATSDDPDRAITRWESVLERAPSAITLFRLLVAEPELLERLVATLTLAPTLADELGRRPELLDVLIDPKPFDFDDPVRAMIERMEERCARGDYEAQLDSIRWVTGETRFALGVALIEHSQKPSVIAQGLSATAEAAIDVAVRAASQEFAKTHGRIAGGELIVLGLGRLGGGALTHTSDLDMIYLFTGEFDAQSDGVRPLGATLYFNRLASRVSAALSVPTAQGALYEVDTRLRPQGNQGPLAVSLDAFAKYQREAAWIWEHMALTRARVLVGSPAARAQVDATVADVLCKRRDPAELRKAVLKMRGEMAEHKEPKGLLDVKLLRGGLVDVEFLVHFLQLRHGHEIGGDRTSTLNPDLMSAIRSLASEGLADQELASAYDLLTGMLVAGRLLSHDGQKPAPAAAKALARACGHTSYAKLKNDFADARTIVARCWSDTFEQSLEIE